MSISEFKVVVNGGADINIEEILFKWSYTLHFILEQ